MSSSFEVPLSTSGKSVGEAEYQRIAKAISQQVCGAVVQNILNEVGRLRIRWGSQERIKCPNC